MDTVVAALVAVFTEGDTQPVQALLDVMSIRRPSLITDSAWQRLDRGQMLAIRGCQILAIQTGLCGRVRTCDLSGPDRARYQLRYAQRW